MRWILLVTGPVYGTQHATSAFRFAKAIIANNHKLLCVFFYGEGISNANRLTSPASDEFDLVRAWKKLHIEQGVNLYVCSSAAMRRGLINIKTFTKNFDYKKNIVTNLESGFVITGLSSLAKTILQCDRLVQF
ncbi:MAG: sulfurtransferase complex subunit TusD [Candidatus Dasytiphilus stammeri]